MQYAKETAAVLPSDGGAAGAGLGAGLGLSLGAQMMRATQTEAQATTSRHLQQMWKPESGWTEILWELRY